MTVMTRVLGAAALAMAAAAPALASPLVWTLTDVHFDDDATASGTFTYDADTGLISDWSITISGSSVLPDFTYTKDGIQDAEEFPYGVAGFALFSFTDSADPFSTDRFFNLVTVRALSDSGGIVALVADGSSVDCDNCGNYHTVDRGSVVALGSSPTPEPATWALTILGFGAIGSTLRMRRPARVVFG